MVNICFLKIPYFTFMCFHHTFTVIFIDSLLAYDRKYNRQVHLDNWAYKIVNKQMTDYFDVNIFED